MTTGVRVFAGHGRCFGESSDLAQVPQGREKAQLLLNFGDCRRGKCLPSRPNVDAVEARRNPEEVLSA